MSDFDISVVSGTYNRLQYLKKMVGSVRKSVGPDLVYEIVLVDGGSTDGTLEWCREQSDIKLIEQGKLVGGIKAFNTGCEAARGEYVVILNDDIEVVDGTIKRSYDYLQRHPAVGQVAYANRVAEGAAAPRAKYSISYRYLYGQCCITRRWVGDLAGWWGKNEGLHTYGGDSRLGMRIWEMGYRVDSLEGCEIIDHVVLDKMRTDRTKLLRPVPDGPHKDTIAFRKVWDGRLPRKERWIAAPSYRLGWKAARGELRSLRFRHNRPGTPKMRQAQLRAFKEFGPAMHVDQTAMVAKNGIKAFQADAEELINQYKPDIVMFQAHGAGNIQPETVLGMKERWPWMAFTNFDGDLHNPLRPFHYEIAAAVDLQLLISPDLFPKYVKNGAPNVAWWSTATEDAFIEAGAKRPRVDKLTGPDVICLMNRTPPEVFPEAQTRIDSVVKLFNSKVDFKVYGVGWDRHDVKASGVTYNNDAASADLYRSARLALSVSQAKHLYGYSSNRIFFAGAAGCPVVCQKFNGMEDLGFVDGETVISWSTFSEMFEKIDYYLKHAEEREAIGKACRKMVLARHTYTPRLEALFAFLDDL